MFTGKNKEQFEKWGVSEKGYTLVNREYLAVYMDKDRSLGSLVYWTDLPQEMKNGILLEYLDSVDFYIHIGTWSDGKQNRYFYAIRSEDGETVFGVDIMQLMKSRQEALTEAFKKADELINKI